MFAGFVDLVLVCAKEFLEDEEGCTPVEHQVRWRFSERNRETADNIIDIVTKNPYVDGEAFVEDVSTMD